ncbi:hemocytin [Sitophilus oryzae]|uniref:Hemocytin n=1 Tax=Sitophilus oryzae TaxID=7048 RepID=A0A6J2XG35_SITOR|nr:hemocytin [Sitophilus oryzae]
MEKFNFLKVVVFVIVIFIQRIRSEGYIPQFLKTKYGGLDSFGGSTLSSTKTKSSYSSGGYNFGSGVYDNQPDPYGGALGLTKTKTKFKTKTKTKFGSYSGGCTGTPEPVMNAGMRCSSHGRCKVECESNYQFPNGKNDLMLKCVGGQWKPVDESWEAVPSCQPICLPECQNNGICIEPNQCQCPESFSGPQCQFENKPCLNYPILPKNSRRSCRSTQCTIECMPNYQFPDGSTITTMTCKNGLWVPMKNQWITVPDCQATCSPPCLNGGNCLSFNYCQCPQDFRGPQCQYSIDVCSVKKLQFNGGYNCSGDMTSFGCSLSCPEGIAFQFEPEPVYTCLYSTGEFQPSPIPQCVYPSNYNIVSQGSSSNSMQSNVHSFIHEYFPKHHSFSTFSPQEDEEALFEINRNKHLKPQYQINIPEQLLNESHQGVFPTLSYGEISNEIVDLVPKPGSCFTWSGSHFKTFDGKVYSFDSKCPHIFFKDAIDGTFSVIVQNHPECYKGPSSMGCSKIIKIYYQDKEYFLKRSDEGLPIFASTKKVLPIPGQLPGIRVTMAANYIVLSLDSIGVTIKWDGQQLVHAEVKESMWNRTEGLCGRMDGDIENDMLTKEGHVAKSVITMASSWKIDDLEEPCIDTLVDEHSCNVNSINGELGRDATHFCTKILSDSRFSACSNAVDITSLLESCRWDYCNCPHHNDPSECTCETLEVYIRDCTHKGVKGLTQWRDENTCPMKCTGGKVYMNCGPKKGQAMCGAVSILPEVGDTCIEGCYCPEGTVLHDNKCITRDQCPCKLRGKSFSPGSSIPKDCNTCTCNNGEWECTQVSCGARCGAVGDPHYITFDGKRFDFMGQCSYYLMKTDNFSIEAENVACAGAISEAMNFPVSVSAGLPSCTKTVTIRINGQVIKLKQNHDVVVNGIDITKIPHNVAGVNIRAVSSIFLQTELPNGIEVWWDGMTRVYIDLPANFKDKTRGLCGTFNSNQKDDFLTPDDDIEQSVIAFANKWKTEEMCNDVPEVLSNHPCDVNLHKKVAAEKHCSKLRSDLFKDCHWYVDPEQFYQDCMYDMCSCEFKISKCLCPTLSAYALECSSKGVKIDWRNEVRECGIHCPGGQKYQVCGNACTRTCNEISLRPDCKRQCVEGCNCPEGEALDDNGECIPIGQCKCQHEGLDFPAGYKEIRPGTKGLELCTCLHAIWQCKLATIAEIQDFPRANDLKAKCDSSRNFEFTTCEDVEPVTCKNMHKNDHFSPTVCHAGCKCKEGYVLDSRNKICVKPTDCPCQHGGRSYKEKSIVQNECNTCTCKNGKWSCTDRQCTAECSAWGDSHYKTFDGKHFDYQGQCDYVLAKGNLESDTFDVTIQNVPCGSLGTSCSKSVTIRIISGDDNEVITLTKDKSVPKFVTKKHVTIREIGLFVIVEAPDLGLVVHWDKGTRVYVKVDPRWKNKIKGLCGNYNDNEEDDFQTPSGGLSEASAKIFGDSWRLQNYCPEALEVEDTCAERPDRKVWALKKCGVLKSSLFAPCHSEVPLDAYFDRCVFDACACDQGGDCQCLCTALAAYAQECNNRGAPVKWRSQQLCPVQCDERCSTYTPCMSTCPHETCDNLLTNSKLTKNCGEDTCVEGCNPKPCPPDHVYLNESYTDCVPRNTCKPVCLELDGVTYYEGDLVEEDDCHSCYCSRGEKICKGQPCSTTEFLEYTTEQNEQTVQCTSGWTSWLNQDKVKVVKGRKQKKLNDVEPVPTPIILNQLKNSSKCTLEEMTDIECLTTDGRHPKELELDVECSLENGLICRSSDKKNPCPDFKIRVLCSCNSSSECDVNSPNKEHPTDCRKFLQCDHGKFVEKTCGPDMFYNPESMTCDWEDNVIKIKPTCGNCPPGTIKENCAVRCDRLCANYLSVTREEGMCKEGTKCEAGCVSASNRVKCQEGYFWLNENTCVSKADCMCISNEGRPVKPGEIVYEGVCMECQCVDNFYSCHDNCQNVATTETWFEKVVVSELYKEPPTTQGYLVPSVSPPPLCTEDRYINLIQGDQPLPDSAFSASSVLSASFAPKYGKLNTKITEKSGGSWAPQYTNQEQYLEVDLGQQEPVYGVIVQGSPLYDEYVTSYMVLYSPDGFDFYYVLNEESPPRPQIFRGSIDGNTPVKQIFNKPFEASIVRIKPQTWNNGISLRVEIIGCSELISTTVSEVFVTLPPDHPSLCDDEMGLSNGSLVNQQIKVSSELSSQFSKKYIRLNNLNFWQPLSDSPTEWVQFDFLEPRDITGVVTKGGSDGWVTAYSVKYSHNELDWNPILDDETEKEKIFPGNFDENSPQVNNFALPINARYIKLIPLKWKNKIQLRVELHGCFKPYPILEIPSTTTESSLPCNNCPGVKASTLEMEACRCAVDLWFDGLKCVNRTQCPCMVGHISYEVGTAFEKEDCSECICKLGGVSYCTPKECGSCKEGLRSTVTSTCHCTCQPCPEGTTLCRTSNICINSTLWCNGIQDCPDDELNCVVTTVKPTTRAPTTTTKKPKTCPVVECQPGYKKVVQEMSRTEAHKAYLSPMIVSQAFTKTKRKQVNSYGAKSPTKTSVKTTQKKYTLPKPKPSEVVEEIICPQYKCVLNKPRTDYIHTVEECPPIICQANFIPVLDYSDDYGTKTCPTYSCYPQPQPDAICNITGRTFNTFDNTELKYDICNHVIGRDLEYEDWEVSLKKNCSQICSRDLIIKHHDHEVIIRSDLSIQYDGYEYSMEQIKNIGGPDKGFSVMQLGSTVLFISNRFGFWIIWNKLANVKFGVVHKLEGKVDGLCGYFNDDPDDDKRKPDGTLARTTAEFGDSWILDKEQPEWCEAKACPLHIQNQAWDICTKVKEQPLGQCAKVLDIEGFISRCLETTCSCLEKSPDNHTAAEECRCNAMQTFVIDCLSTDSSVDLSDWRVLQDCPATCDAPLVYHDCYQRKCEPTCKSIADPNVCPKINNMCFPGCYCPAGHVRKDDTCIKPSSCRDCECNVLPHLQYVTYDESNFTVSGNCVYVMSRDALIGDEETHKWQVLITNHPCKTKPDKMCVGKVTILYKGHKVHILVDYFRNKLKLIVDSERIDDFEEIEDWAKVRETGSKHFKILLTDDQVEVSVYYPSLGVSVKAPSHKYGGKLEGLCGDCNKNPSDDIRNPDGSKPKDINDFTLNWLYEHLPGGQSREQCGNQPEEQCPEIPQSDDPCMQLLDGVKFGQCLNVQDPSLFLDWCKKDTCGNHPELSCSAIEAYARDCASAGFCVNWRNEYCPAENCPSDQHYEPCATSKQATCDDVKAKSQKTKASTTPKKSGVIEGCFCPEGKVLLNDTCVLPKDCEVCDAEGHHPGETWKKDKCTTCKCEGTSLKCDTQYCPGKETICERGFNAIKISSKEDECCDKYACVPEPTAGPTCEPPQKLVCGPDQILKLDTKPNGCQTFICECQPADECEKVDIQSDKPLEPGYIRKIDEEGCCPVVKLICKKEKCPDPKECPQYHTLKKEEIEGKCCPVYSCEAPKNKCIFETEYTEAKEGGERSVTKFEKQKILKNANDTWNDGPCRDCKCSLTSIGTYQAACSQTDCPSIESQDDYSEYELTPVLVPGQCCPKIKRSACKYEGKTYKIGEKWDKEGDRCVHFECVETDTVQKQTTVQTCNKECKLGYQYEEPEKESKKCCGTCKQVACVVDDIVHQVGDEWSSSDHCTNYFCLNLNDSLQVEAVKVSCSVVSEENLKDFVYEFIPVEGQCCKDQKIVACKVGDKVHKIGDIWPSPDGDKCKNVTCVKKPNSHELVKQESIETCKKDCSKGWEYKESKTQCCGECVQTSCVVNDELKKPEETWKSEDGCVTYSCDNLGGQLLVSSNHEACPYIEDCPAENVYTKGCCKYCNVTIEAMTLCSPQPMPLKKTVGMIEVSREGRKCVNKHELNDFTECIGTCHSSTYFNIKTGLHESVCSCCQATDYQSLEIELDCDDGSKFKKKVAVPSKCSCVACGEKSPYTPQ